jgi:hypothetical protein
MRALDTVMDGGVWDKLSIFKGISTFRFVLYVVYITLVE